MVFWIILIALLIIGIILFAVWFFSMIAEGKCPLCALNKLKPTKLTIDVSNEPNYNNNVPATPIMGWSSWNTARNHIDEDTIVEIARAMCSTGLADAGYKYVNLDDCWQSSMRDADGMLQGDLESFPSGIKSLCDRINMMGLKLGIYTSNGTLTCEDLPASLGCERLDAKTFASWGIEYFKYDFCHNEAISGYTPAIEYVDVSPIGSRATARLSPDNAKYTGKAKTVTIKDLPTGKAIGMLNHNAGTASFDLDIINGGEYAMTVHYNKTRAFRRRYLQIVINGKVYEVFFPTGKGFTPDGREQIIVQLNSGVNHIVLRNPVVTRADSSYVQYKRMSNALLDATKEWAAFTRTEEKPITFSICEWGTSKPWKWGAKVGNMWRTTHDIFPNWTSIVAIYSRNLSLYKYSKPGHVNDPDMLEVGNGKLNPEENKSHFTLWCMMAAPLVLGNDVRLLTDDSKKSQILLSILTNEDMIAIDQDPLVAPAKKIGREGRVDILARPLANGDVAICFFNKSKKKVTVEYDIDTLKEVKYLDVERTSNASIYDLWTAQTYHADTITAPIQPHGVKAYRISF